MKSVPLPISDSQKLPAIQGRGTNLNPGNRFERIHVEMDFDHVNIDDHMEKLSRPATQYFVDTSKSIIATNDSPDVGFTHSINPYRGCSHGCIYCYARPTHEYLGMSAGLDFESKVMVKLDAAELLRRELSSPKWKPVTLSISGVTDCYQPAERHFKITRSCIEVLAEFKNPLGIVTKSHLVTRDIDLLAQMAKWSGAIVMVSLTTLSADLTQKMEPRASAPKRRLEAIRKLTDAGVPCGVMVAPIIPALTDHEVPSILKAAKDAGARSAGFVPLRLPFAVADLFVDWLEQHFPDRKNKILNRVRALRSGKLNDPNFMTRMRGDGVWAEQLKALFELGKREAGIIDDIPALSTDHFRAPTQQGMLW